MPFPKWAVEPVFLVRKPLPPDKSEPGNFYPIVNASLVSCLRQLASVAKIADKIFDEIGSECRLVAERTSRIRDKIHACNEIVSSLNARAVQVPVSDLTTTSRHLRSHQPYSNPPAAAANLFLPSTRPPCVDLLYGLACGSPVPLMCTVDRYRTDGLSAQDLFMVTPVVGGDGGKGRKRRRLLEIETRKPANFSLVATNQDRIESGTASLPPMVLPSRGYILKQNESLELERLPSPEEQAMLVSLEYPSTIVPVDTSGASFSRMSLMRRSLIHVDFVIKHRKSKKSNKKRSKRRHTFCEGQNRDLEQAIRNVTNTSCQTDDDVTVNVTATSSSSSLMRMVSMRRRSRSVQDNSRRVDVEGQEDKEEDTEEDKEATPTKSFASTSTKKSMTLRSLAQGFNSSLSAAISAVKLRGSSRKQDDGRSSSGNWSASSSTRASVDSSDHPGVAAVSSPSRSSLGKDSLLSDATQQDANRSRDDILPIQLLTQSPVKKKKFAHMGLPWETNTRNRTSNTPTPEPSNSNGTPLVRSPYSGRRGVSDDGDSSVYSVDTDGYYTSMHTDSGLWCNVGLDMKSEDVLADLAAFRQRKESQSSVSTNDSSINSFLSKSATECSSNSDSFKLSSCPQPPMRVSSCKSDVAVRTAGNVVSSVDVDANVDVPIQELDDSDKSYSPHPPNGSNSESEHEVRDRIRYKTAITPHRYPSMCAVSPETSDDEIADLKRRTVIPNVNVVVAEIHQDAGLEETEARKDKTDCEQVPKPYSHSPSPCYLSSAINMYRCETPVPSNFSSSILGSQPVGSSTPRSGVNVTTFSPEFNETINPNTKGSNFETANHGMAAHKPDSPMPKTDKSLIPLKYAQRITVTPIARNDASAGCTSTIKRMPMQQLPNNETKTENQTSLSFTDAASSYISFKAPDSPVSTMTSFKMDPEGKLSSPTGSLSRPIASPSNSLSRSVPSATNSLSRSSFASPTNSLSRSVASPNGSLSRSVARVTLDPTGNVVYASNSLERSRTVSPSQNNPDQQGYATLPMCQSNVVSRSTTPISNQHRSTGNERSITSVRSTTPVNNRSTTPISNRSTTPVNYRSSTPVNNRSTTPVNNRSTTPVNNTSNTPVNNRSTTPVNSRSTTPVNRYTAPVNNRSTTPVNNISTTKNNRSTTPVTITPIDSRSTTPVMNRSITPVNDRQITLVNNRSANPVNMSAAAVNNKYTTPVNNRSIVSDDNRPTNIVNNRVPTTVNSAPTNNRSMSSRPTIPIVTRCTTRMREVQTRDTNDSIGSYPNDGFDKTEIKTSVQSLPDQKQAQQYQFSSFKSSNAGTDFNFRPSRGGRFCRSYFPSHLISQPSGQTTNGNMSPTSNSPSSSPASVRQSQDTRISSSPSHDYSAGRNYPITNPQRTLQSNQTTDRHSNYQTNPSGYVPNPHSDIPHGQSSSNTSTPNRYHTPNNRYSESNPKSDWVSKSPSGSPNSSAKGNSFSSLSPPDLIPSGQSPPSTLDVTSSTRKTFRADSPSKDQDGNKNIKSLSANELFAIIHNSKKRHNIKSESELSMSPMSSRSVSPALSQSSASRLQPVETGVLSRRYESPDRSKWCNSLPSSKKKFPEKQQPVGGNTKPTSMRDFKMLLLQTRTGSQDSNPRPSAAELLKVSPPKPSTPTPLKSPVGKHTAPVGTYTTPVGTYSSPVGTYSPGHGTVPLKRSLRTRSPYLTRYDSAYPPIIEDCSEEMESYEDSKCLQSDNLPYKTVNNNYEPSSPSQSSAKKATSTWV